MSPKPKVNEIAPVTDDSSKLLQEICKEITRIRVVYEQKLPQAYEALGRKLSDNKFDISSDAVIDCITEIRMIKAQIYVLEEAEESTESKTKTLLKRV